MSEQKLDEKFVKEQTELAMFAFMAVRRYMAKGHELAQLDPLSTIISVFLIKIYLFRFRFERNLRK